MRLFSLFTSIVVVAASPAVSLTIIPNTNATALVNNILGSGVSLVGAPTLVAASNQTGTFTNGASEVGFGSGIVMSSGDVTQIAGPNTNTNVPETRGVGANFGHDISTDLGTAGAAEIPNSFDASILSFDFQFGDGSVGGAVNFAFTFASEEYVDYVGSVFNDEFQLLVDGVNLGTVGGQKVNVNNINDQANSASYINNVENTNGIPNADLGIGFDGLTTTLLAQSGALGAGVHTAKFIVADVSDGILDAGVFIQAGSFDPSVPVTTPKPKDPSVTPIPLPAPLAMLLGALAALAALRRTRASA